MGLFKYGTLEFLTFLKVCSFDWISPERRTNMFLDTDFFFGPLKIRAAEIWTTSKPGPQGGFSR